MHPDEIAIDEALVSQLLAAQFPDFAGLPLRRTGAHGTDHVIYRLGEDLAVRLPRHPGAAGQAEKEQAWLPRLAAYLPAPIPAPVEAGAACELFPFGWSICRWLEGQTAAEAAIEDEIALATDLGRFVAAMRGVPAADAPGPGPHNAWRGVGLRARNKVTQAAIDELGEHIDARAARACWDAALEAEPWGGEPCWLHGDLMPSNLLVSEGRLAAVLDFGCMGAGDPACDLIPGWNLFSGVGRARFQDAAEVDAATWARGRGWALSVALVQLPYYAQSNRIIAGNAQRTIDAVLGEA